MSQQINLYNAELKKSGMTLSLLNMLQGAGAILLCTTLFYAYQQYQTGQIEQQLAEVSSSLAAEQGRLDKLAEEFARQRSGMTFEQELKKLAAEAASQRKIIDTLKGGMLGSTKGYSAYMQAFARQSVNGLWLTGFNIEGDAAQLSLSGAVLSAELVPAYIMRLNNESVMRGKAFASLHIQMPKVEAGKSAASHLEFMLQSVSAEDAEKSGAEQR